MSMDLPELLGAILMNPCSLFSASGSAPISWKRSDLILPAASIVFDRFNLSDGFASAFLTACGPRSAIEPYTTWWRVGASSSSVCIFTESSSSDVKPSFPFAINKNVANL